MDTIKWSTPIRQQCQRERRRWEKYFLRSTASAVNIVELRTALPRLLCPSWSLSCLVGVGGCWLEEPRDADFPGIFNGIPRTFSHLLARSRMPAQTFLAFLAFLASSHKFARFFSRISRKPSHIFLHFTHLLASPHTFSHFLAIFENFSHLLAYRGSSRMMLMRMMEIMERINTSKNTNTSTSTAAPQQSHDKKKHQDEHGGQPQWLSTVLLFLIILSSSSSLVARIKDQ